MTVQRASSLFIGTVITVCAFLAAFAGAAFAAGAVTPDDGSLIDLAKPVLSAVMAGNYVAAAALALVLAVAGVRSYGGKRFPWLLSDAGGALLTVVGSFGGAIGTAALAGVAPSLGLMWAAFGVALTAAGGYSLIRKLGLPALRKIAAKVPGLSLVVKALELVFDNGDPVKDAKAAGDAAVLANPGAGVVGVVGEPTDLE